MDTIKITVSGNIPPLPVDWGTGAQAGGAVAHWLAAYERHGADAPQAVKGAFSVVINWPDGRVFCAVDRFSLHSLCYRVADGALRVAERADELAGTDGDIDPQALYDYL
ncbi:MAG: hypothetical protein LBE81_01445 [Azonexus sp.]|jgi:asparagine synthase (glutamine-hydrolysing)|uniref:hypothetical protein n=1 Tax=Azonexus sp. TaxID=1872668 RepID=UPI002837D5F9|nr:hypothetical protein [Azonexus sp.]MDR0775291.1 hypothetical protein [Azonexus sp.]